MTYLDIFSDVPWWVWAIHVALYPAYHILGTAKHEGSHAVGAMVQGLRIVKFKVLPSRVSGKFLWGHVQYTGAPNKTTMLMPYVADTALFCIGVVLFGSVAEEWWAAHVSLLLPIFIVTTILPLVDGIYNIGKWVVNDTGDFADAFRDL